MARGRGRGRGGVDTDIMYDTLYMTHCSLPQGVMGSQMTFMGSQSALIARMNSLTPTELAQIRDANLIIFGTKTKSADTCLSIIIILLGSLLILPLIALCLECYKRITSPAFAVNIKTYEGLQKLFRQAPNLTNITITVYDNELGNEKFNTLAKMISGSRVKGLTLANAVLPFGMSNDEYSDFKENGQKLKDQCKQQGVAFQATWYTSLIA